MSGTSRSNGMRISSHRGWWVKDKGLHEYIHFLLLQKKLPQIQWLKANLFWLSHSSTGQKSGRPAGLPALVLAAIGRAEFLSGGRWEEFASKLILVVGRTQFPAAVGPGPHFPDGYESGATLSFQKPPHPLGRVPLHLQRQ